MGPTGSKFKSYVIVMSHKTREFIRQAGSDNSKMSSLGDDSFERIVQEEREAANGDEEKAMKSLTARVLESLIKKLRRRHDDDGADFPKKVED
ncbi:hypothetical protein Ddye_007488 [Dipteronia dyeriana]|uniref:Uncharacterized protein n=1 Tax=Dipteronia dyeriana TaxID=168575 RepID=A0AAE0CRI4_9ROSI|nr:hypothetical protein Ddye_007488 [Dipteronia dyeriana]